MNPDEGLIAGTAAEKSEPMKTRPTKNKRMAVLLTLCMALSLLPITAFANQYTHTYHTKVETTAQVTIKGADGIEIETTEVKKSGDFIEGGLSADAVQAEIARIDEEIKVQFSARGSVTMEKRIGNMVFDHFESSNIIKLDDDETGGVNKDLHVNEYQVYQITYDLIVQEAPQPASTITAAAIENAKFDYQAGDAPQATATVAAADADKYQIAYECWQQFENNNPVAAWYSDNGSHGSLPTITEFESGKKYMYFLMLKPKDGSSFSNDVAMTVNGKSVKSSLSRTFLYAPAVKTMTPSIVETNIKEIRLDGAALSFKAGDKPSFSGSVRNPYVEIVYQEWQGIAEDGYIIGITSSDKTNKLYGDRLLTQFKDGKEYRYSAIFKISDSGKKKGCYFTERTKLYINGREIDQLPDMMGDDISFYQVLSITPEAESLEPSQKYTVTYTDGVEGEEIFKDQSYTVESGEATPAFDGTPTRKGYTFAGWKPEVADYVTNDVTYEAVWKSNSVSSTTPSENKPSTGGTTSPKTGDTSNPVLWITLLFVSGGAAAGTVVIGKKKKTMK